MKINGKEISITNENWSIGSFILKQNLFLFEIMTTKKLCYAYTSKTLNIIIIRVSPILKKSNYFFFPDSPFKMLLIKLLRPYFFVIIHLFKSKPLAGQYSRP